MGASSTYSPNEVIEVANFAALPATGLDGIIYMTADDGQLYTWNGSSYDSTIGTTNLSIGTVTATTVNVNSDTGTNATLPSATVTEAGLMSAADKVILNGISDTDDQTAAEVSYDNATSGLTATDTQAAIDEVEGRVDTLESSSHAAVTLNADDATQQSANLVGQEIQLVQATASTDGVMSAEDKARLDAMVAPKKIDPPQITVNQNNYGPTGWDATVTRINVTTTGNRNVTGLVATGFTQLHTVTFVNSNAIGGDNISLKNQDAGSTAANRFKFNTSTYTLEPGEFVTLIRSTDNFWLVSGDK